MSSIKKLAIDSTGIMLVRDAKGEVEIENGQQWSITFHSPGTKQFQKAKHDYEQKRSNSLSAIMTGKADNKRTAEDDNCDTAEFLAACTVSLNNFDYEGGKGYEAIKAMYMDIEIGHIAIEANKFLGDRGNFVKAKPTSSPATSVNQPG